VNVVICWTHISGYMAACWRAISSRADLKLAVIGFKSHNVKGHDIQFQDEIVRGLNVRLLAPDEIADAALVKALVVRHAPDVVVVPGWVHASYKSLVAAPELARARFVMTMDTPYRGTWRQRLGRFRIAGYLKRFDRVVVPGERAWQLARFLGVPEEKVRRGQYGIDLPTFAPLLAQRRAQPGGWPRKFLFTGRYHPEKGIDVLLAAYRAYRNSVSDPWGLTCCGTGPMNDDVSRAEGVTNMGFVQPGDMPAVIASHGVFVVASRFDPWPLAIVEACASGMPVIHSEVCGSAVELVRPYFNGLGVATENVEELAGAMRWCHAHYDALPEMGARGQPLAAAYSADLWAERWMTMFQELVR
jgi:glycosyltransferase involved in cell wall biosynthesis